MHAEKLCLWMCATLAISATFTVSHVQAALVQMQWSAPTTNANGTPLTDLAGYKVYFGQISKTYTASIDVGNQTQFSLSGLQVGLTYYFAVTAYDVARNESAPSTEAKLTLLAIDTDSDGLTDTDELLIYGTDPLNPDTDGDGLKDGDEVLVYKTDPKRQDTDGDGAADGVEVSQKTNPLDSKSFPQSGGSLFAVNAGGSAYVAGNGISYQADTKFSGGTTYTTSTAIAGTPDSSLYRSVRYGNFTYAIPVTNGDYAVILQFAEVYHTGVGRRVFDVVLEGQVMVDNLDLVAKAGAYKAYDVAVRVSVRDGVLNITFQSIIDAAVVSAITVSPVN